MQLSVKHLLGIRDLTRQDIQIILDTATQFKEVLQRPIKKVPSLRDVTIVNLFFDAKGNIGMIGHMDLVAHIVAVKSNIQLAILHLTGSNQLADRLYYLVAHKYAPWLNADKNRVVEINIILQYLVTKPPDYNSQLLLV